MPPNPLQQPALLRTLMSLGVIASSFIKGVIAQDALLSTHVLNVMVHIGGINCNFRAFSKGTKMASQ